MKEQTMEIAAHRTAGLVLPASAPTLNAGMASEAVLVQGALGGCGLAFRHLVEPHLLMLHRIAYRACGNEELAQDAVQETLTLAFERLDRFEARSTFKAFLAAVAARRAKTLLRSEKRRRIRESKTRGFRPFASPDESLCGDRIASVVRTALLQMPAKRREVVLLRLDGGLSYREIAEARSISEGSARVLVHMGVKQLREACDKSQIEI